ncbi:MAG: cardiolipin synthase, partial [Oscillospiraceae bacterium]|nr:cardiolipin synthase [Oscillospiraceae bacterium]
VRVLYDDVGSIGFIDSVFVKRMESLGIKCRVFNPLVPVLNMIMNNRDHRKLTVIDGKVGFTGGYNLADKYFNLENPYGHWKDTGVKLTGDAVRSLTVTFLELWAAMSKEEMEDMTSFFPENTYKASEKCLVQPYADSPLDDELVGENVYMNIVKMAKDYVYFTTPYLIISDELQRELTMAVKRGVDVRIITPGIPDKKTVFEVTRSNYASLVNAGVKIYEYTPGFLHAKMYVSDDIQAIVGSANMDFRSMYLHYENCCSFYGGSMVREVKNDFENTLKECRRVTMEQVKKTPLLKRIFQIVFRIWSPMM